MYSFLSTSPHHGCELHKARGFICLLLCCIPRCPTSTWASINTCNASAHETGVLFGRHSDFRNYSHLRKKICLSGKALSAVSEIVPPGRPCTPRDMPALIPSAEVEALPHSQLPESQVQLCGLQANPASFHTCNRLGGAGCGVPTFQMRKLRLREAKDLPSKLHSRKGTRPTPPIYLPLYAPGEGKEMRKEPAGSQEPSHCSPSCRPGSRCPRPCWGVPRGGLGGVLIHTYRPWVSRAWHTASSAHRGQPIGDTTFAPRPGEGLPFWLVCKHGEH